MRLSELIEYLTDLQAEAGDDDPEVRFAHQPSYPFEYSMGEPALVELADEATVGPPEAVEAAFEARGTDEDDDPDEDDLDYLRRVAHRFGIDMGAPERVVYLPEGSQLGYLPGHASKALGWR